MNRTRIIADMIDEKWSSRKKFAESIGIPPTTLQSIIQRGVGKASIDNVLKVCKGLGITVEQLERIANVGEIVGETSATYLTKNEKSTYTYIPVPVSAGVLTSIESVTSDNTKEITLPDELMGKYAGDDDIFIMRVNGDSMNKVIPHDSMIAVKKVNLDALNNDDIVVFSNDHHYSVKRYYNDVKNQRLNFSSESTDRSFTDQTFSYDETENLLIHGKVVLYIVTT